jgi:BirA family transcriptional regulator, biotin operon repressor / biotin---[acetyl-CoA-carboxylase] ligase
MKTSPADPTPLTFTLLRVLADGEFHSGETMAKQLRISRASVNNALQGIDSYGMTLYRVRGRGYCLADPPQWLDARIINNHLGKHRKSFQIEIIDSASSSNTLLLREAAHGAPCGRVLAVEWQSGGRGRMGRTWHSGLGNALTFSLLWRFELGLSALSGLSLGAGVALIRGLRSLGVENLRLKWPNDVLDAHNAKLGGILIEAQGDMLGPATVVIGIGINLHLPQQVSRHIDQPASSLSNVNGATPNRNLLLAVLLRELDSMLRKFSVYGFAPLREEWESYHAHQNQYVRLLLPNGQESGIACGVSDEGALKLQTDAGMQVFHAGDISLQSGKSHAVA